MAGNRGPGSSVITLPQNNHFNRTTERPRLHWIAERRSAAAVSAMVVGLRSR